MAAQSRLQNTRPFNIDVISYNGDGLYAFKPKLRKLKKRFLRTRVPKPDVYLLQETHAGLPDGPALDLRAHKMRMRAYMNPAMITNVKAVNRLEDRTFTKYGTAIMVSETFIHKNSLTVRHEIIDEHFTHMISLHSPPPPDAEAGALGPAVALIYNVYFKSGDAAERRRQIARVGAHMRGLRDIKSSQLVILGGDVNFQSSPGDLLSRPDVDSDFSWSQNIGEDARIFDEEILKPCGLEEACQFEPTLRGKSKCSLGRNDRFYTSISGGLLLTRQVRVSLPTVSPKSVSDHSPVWLRISNPPLSRLPRMPLWVAEKPEYDAAVKKKYESMCHLFSNPWECLLLLQLCMWEVADDFKRATPNPEPSYRVRLGVAVSCLAVLQFGRRRNQSQSEWSKVVLRCRLRDPGLRPLVKPKYLVDSDEMVFDYDIHGISEYIRELFEKDIIEEKEQIKKEEEDTGEKLVQRREALARRAAQIIPGARTTYDSVRTTPKGRPIKHHAMAAHTLLDRWSFLFQDLDVDQQQIWRYLQGYKKRLPTLQKPTEENTAYSVAHSGSATVGPDGVHGKHYRGSSSTSVPVLHNCVIALADPLAPEPPPTFTFARLVLPPKKIPEWDPLTRTRAIFYEDVRPLSVQNFSSRITTGAFRPVLLSAVNSLCEDSQSGFREGTTKNVKIIDSKLHCYMRSRSRGGIFLADIQRAFPSLSRVYCVIFLMHVLAPMWFITLFSRVYHRVTHFFSYHEILLMGAVMMRGLTQGCPLSAFYFLIFVDPLLYFLGKKLRRGEALCGFADDLALALLSAHRLVIMIPEFEKFGLASLCHMSYDKSLWIPSHEPLTSEKEWGISSIRWRTWQDIKFKNAALYLGYLLGRFVRARDRYLPIVGKFMRTMTRWMHSSHGPNMRVFILNLFLLSLFGYMDGFDSIPDEFYSKICTLSVVFVYRINNMVKSTLLCALKEMGGSANVIDLRARSLAARARNGYFCKYEDQFTRRASSMGEGRYGSSLMFRLTQANEHISRLAGKSVANVFHELIQIGPDFPVKARKKLQKTLMEYARPKLADHDGYLKDRFRRWNVKNTSSSGFLVGIFKRQLLLARTAIQSSWQALFRLWTNGWFTHRRFQRKGRACPFCAHLSEFALLLWDPSIEKSQGPEDCIEHFMECWVLNHIAKLLGLIPRDADSWWEVAQRRPPIFGLIYDRVSPPANLRDMISAHRYADFVGAVYALHNSLRHSQCKFSFMETVRAMKKILQENSSAKSFWAKPKQMAKRKVRKKRRDGNRTGEAP